MEQIKKVIRQTGSMCSCNGNIVETFTKKYGKSNGVAGPGYHCPSWVESIGFGCDKCGRQYGEPVFIPTKPTAQISHELTLYTANTTKSITRKDVPEETKWIRGGITPIPVAGKILRLPTKKCVEIIGKVPPELKKIPIGTLVYVLPSDSVDPHALYRRITLSKDLSAKTFAIRQECLK